MAELSESLEARVLADDLTASVVSACDAAVARVWILGPGDECETCAMREECPSRIRCLHLISSAGLTTRVEGAFRRFPLGAREVGGTAITGRPLVARGELAASGLADPAWFARHGVRSFVAAPIKSSARILGVLAVFSRRELSDDEVALLSLATSQTARALEALERWRAPRGAAAAQSEKPAPARPRKGRASSAPPPLDAAPLTLAEAQRRAISHALAASGGRISGPHGAAERLGLHPNTLTSRMIRLGMRKRARRPITPPRA